MKTITCISLLAAAALAGGCAVNPIPTAQLEGAREAIAEAQVASIGRAASPELARAQEKLALTQRWIAAKDNGPARWLAEQAQVDAELAAARAASRDAQQALLRAQLEPRGERRVAYRPD